MTYHYDAMLIGAGIMSATLATLIHKANPKAKIAIIEKLPTLAQESSDAMNNAGTGHSAFCELNYTPQKADGSIDISKAVTITEQFEVSRQFWASLVQEGFLEDAKSFIQSVPHCSVVFGEEDVTFLRKRYELMRQNPLYTQMQYSEDPAQIQQRMPLVMQGRAPNQKVAATFMLIGTDVNFGSLTRELIKGLQKTGQLKLLTETELIDLYQNADKTRTLKLQNNNTKKHEKNSKKNQTFLTDFVFLGAGGGALPLLQKSGIPERKQFGGFPVSGQWLVCHNPEVIAQHEAKVYGKAAVGAPPMSVPHLDTRWIDGKKALLFGPYAGFTTKYLKSGSFLDLFGSLRLYNIWTMIQAGLKNLGLTKYLIEQVLQSRKNRLNALKEYLPEARDEDWELLKAGYRVQVIKNDSKQGGILQFGTEVVIASDQSLATLLGASPGASTAVSIMLEVMRKCFPDSEKSFKKLIPSYGQSLHQDEKLLEEMRAWTAETLDLKKPQT